MSVITLDRQPRNVDQQPPHAADERIRLFSDRYGAQAFEELLQLFALPCVTYAEIAKRFGVTRERVRQWHLHIAPESPRGHDRRRLCQIYRRRRRLLDDPIYRAFVRAARAEFPDARVQPVPTKTGFRKRTVRLGQWTVALKKAIRRQRTSGSPSYSLTGSRGGSDFVFFQLGDDSFVFVSSSMIPRGGTTYADDGASKYHAFKNTLAVHGAALSRADAGAANASGIDDARPCCGS